MKVRSRILSPSVARGLAVMCAAVFVASAHTAHAGINVWTSHGPPGEGVLALTIDPIDPRRVYAGTEGGGVFAIEPAAVVGAGTPESGTEPALDNALALGGVERIAT